MGWLLPMIFKTFSKYNHWHEIQQLIDFVPSIWFTLAYCLTYKLMVNLMSILVYAIRIKCHFKSYICENVIFSRIYYLIVEFEQEFHYNLPKKQVSTPIKIKFISQPSNKLKISRKGVFMFGTKMLKCFNCFVNKRSQRL